MQNFTTEDPSSLAHSSLKPSSRSQKNNHTASWTLPRSSSNPSFDGKTFQTATSSSHGVWTRPPIQTAKVRLCPTPVLVTGETCSARICAAVSQTSKKIYSQPLPNHTTCLVDQSQVIHLRLNQPAVRRLTRSFSDTFRAT